MLNFLPICSILKDKQGIEFGGPTELFSLPKHGMPLYDHVYLDGGNIIKENYFQTDLGSNFLYGEKLGKQFDVDCTNELQLSKLKKYDFVVSSHAIEHFANPIKTLKLWEKYLLKDCRINFPKKNFFKKTFNYWFSWRTRIRKNNFCSVFKINFRKKI